jgi:hypothetical protein
MKEDTCKTLSDDVQAYLARGGEIKKIRDCSPKESYYRSFKLYKDINNPKKTYRKTPAQQDPSNRLPLVFSGYNSAKK